MSAFCGGCVSVGIIKWWPSARTRVVHCGVWGSGYKNFQIWGHGSQSEKGGAHSRTLWRSLNTLESCSSVRKEGSRRLTDRLGPWLQWHPHCISHGEERSEVFQACPTKRRPWGRPGYAVPQHNWRRELKRGSPDFLCLFCCPCDPDPDKKMNGWMDDYEPVLLSVYYNYSCVLLDVAEVADNYK